MRGVAVAFVVMLAACGSDGSATPHETTTSTTTAEQALALDGPVMRYPHTSSESTDLSNLMQGVLEIQDDCLYLVVDALDARFPVLWPADTTWNGQAGSVVLPAGESMSMGGSVEGRGGYYYLSDVNRWAGGAASALTEKCLDNAWGQIAAFRNEATSVGPEMSWIPPTSLGSAIRIRGALPDGRRTELLRVGRQRSDFSSSAP